MRPWIIDYVAGVTAPEAAPYIVPAGIAFYFAAIASCGWLLVARCGSRGLSRRAAAAAALAAVIGGLAGARVYYLFHHFGDAVEHPELIFRFGPGIASWGAYIGGLSLFILCLKLKGEEVLRYLDVLCATLGLGVFLIRIACFMNGCCFGTVTGLPWGVKYPQNSFASRYQAKEGLIGSSATQSLAVHPFQLYLSLSGLALFIAATLFWRRRNSRAGETFFFYWALYLLLRFPFEFLRAGAPHYTPMNLTLSQIVIIISLCGLGVWRLLYRRKGPAV